MMTSLPRILAVTAAGPVAIDVVWTDREDRAVDLAGWIAVGGETLSPLRDPDIFASARRGDHGASVEWIGSEDFAIDAYHLRLIADDQNAVRSAPTPRMAG